MKIILPAMCTTSLKQTLKNDINTRNKKCTLGHMQMNNVGISLTLSEKRVFINLE